MEVVTLIREENTARLRFAREDRPVNVLDEACLSQLEAHLDALEKEAPALLVLESGLPGCFIAGADVDVIAAVADEEQARRLAERGQAACRRIAALPSVSVALVDGVCMGGGLEIALACDRIVAVEGERTQLALPEIKLGIHPGFGGCVRLPARVGWMRAVDMILTGKALDARRAAKAGLADLAAKRGQEQAALEWAAGRGKRERRGMFPWWMRLWPARKAFFVQVRKRVLARFRHLEVEDAYPAVPATIDLLESIVGMPEGQALALEAESLGRLAVTKSCKNLIRVFRLGEALKHQEAARRGRDAARAMRKAAVYGAGVMGSGIAWVATRTMDVDLHEVNEEAMARGLKSLAKLARRDARRGRQRLARIRPALDHSGLADADVVIEAVLEELEVKRELWREVEARARPDALLLTNTSSLSVTAMQGGGRARRAKRPERLAGMHFFNPAPKMPLVEVVAGKKTAPETLDKVCALAVAWGKYPVVTADSPGFLVNRCLMPYMVAALGLLEAGQKPAHVDGALKHFGMPMGAIELADQVGLDICRHVGEHLAESFGDRFAMPAWFSRMVEDGLLGAKSGRGFFLHEKGKLAGPNPDLARYLPVAAVEAREGDAARALADDTPPMEADAIVDACLIPMLIEALACLREGVVAEAAHLDAAMVYGIGFPPFRGGLLRWAADRERRALRQAIADAGFELPANLDEALDGALNDAAGGGARHA